MLVLHLWEMYKIIAQGAAVPQLVQWLLINSRVGGSRPGS